MTNMVNQPFAHRARAAALLLAGLLPAVRGAGAGAPPPPPDLPRCALAFVGAAPRGFRTRTAPGLVRHVLLPNARYGCDVFVHYDPDGAGADAADVRAVASLPDVVAAVAGRVVGRRPAAAPRVVLLPAETEEAFERKYGDLVARYCTAADPGTGKPLYFPTADRAYASCADLRNVIKEWDALQATWDALVERGEEQGGTGYGRVAFLRLDALYARPVDVWQLDKDNYDYANRSVPNVFRFQYRTAQRRGWLSIPHASSRRSAARRGQVRRDPRLRQAPRER